MSRTAKSAVAENARGALQELQDRVLILESRLARLEGAISIQKITEDLESLHERVTATQHKRADRAKEDT